MAIALSFFIGVSFRLSAEMIDPEIIVITVWPLTCIAIVVAVELLMRRELQAKDT